MPWWALLPIVAAAALVAWFAYRRTPLATSRRAALSAVRGVTLLLLVVFLMRPVIQSRGEGSRDAVVPILVDASRSMSIDDADGRRRIDQARDLVTRALVPALGKEFQVELFSFGDTLAPVEARDLSATARRSDLSQ